MTIIWATIEAIVDGLLHWYHPIHGHEIQDKVPISLDGKISYLNKMARDPGFGEAGCAALRHLKVQLKRLGRGRHVFLHGVVTDPKGDGREWILQIRNIKEDASLVRQFRFEPADLDQLVAEMADLRSAIAPWALRVMGRTGE